MLSKGPLYETNEDEIELSVRTNIGHKVYGASKRKLVDSVFLTNANYALLLVLQLH